MSFATLIIAVASALVLSYSLSMYTLTHASAWGERGIGAGELSWRRVVQIASGVSVATAGVAAGLGAAAPVAVSLAVFAWMAVLVTVTDYATYLIPRDITLLASGFSLPLMATYWITSDVDVTSSLIQVGIWMILPVVMFVFAMLGMIGMGDIRLFVLAGASIAWWAGAEYVYAGFFLAVVIQLLVTIVAKVLGRGRYEERLTLAQQVERDELAAVESGEDPDDTTSVNPKKKSLKLPAGPAFMYGFFIAAVVALLYPVTTSGELLMRLYGM